MYSYSFHRRFTTNNNDNNEYISENVSEIISHDQQSLKPFSNSIIDDKSTTFHTGSNIIHTETQVFLRKIADKMSENKEHGQQIIQDLLPNHLWFSFAEYSKIRNMHKKDTNLSAFMRNHISFEVIPYYTTTDSQKYIINDNNNKTTTDIWTDISKSSKFQPKLKLSINENLNTFQQQNIHANKNIYLPDKNDIIIQCNFENKHVIKMQSLRVFIYQLMRICNRNILINATSDYARTLCTNLINKYKYLSVYEILHKLKKNSIIIPDEIMHHVRNTKDLHAMPIKMVFNNHSIVWLINHYFNCLSIVRSTFDGVNDRQFNQIYFQSNFRFEQKWKKTLNVMKSDVALAYDDVGQCVKNMQLLFERYERLKHNGISFAQLTELYQMRLKLFPVKNGDEFQLLSKYISDANLYMAYIPNEISGVRIFQHHSTPYIEYLSAEIAKTFHGWIEFNEIQKEFGISSNIFIANFYPKYEFSSVWNFKNGSKQLMVRKRMVNYQQSTKHILKKSLFATYLRRILNEKTDGYLFLSELNSMFYETFKKYLPFPSSKFNLLHQLQIMDHIGIIAPFIFSFEKHEMNETNCDFLIYDKNDIRSPFVIAMIAYEVFRQDFNLRLMVIQRKKKKWNSNWQTFWEMNCILMTDDSKQIKFNQHFMTVNRFHERCEKCCRLTPELDIARFFEYFLHKTIPSESAYDYWENSDADGQILPMEKAVKGKPKPIYRLNYHSILAVIRKTFGKHVEKTIVQPLDDDKSSVIPTVEENVHLLPSNFAQNIVDQILTAIKQQSPASLDSTLPLLTSDSVEEKHVPIASAFAISAESASSALIGTKEPYLNETTLQTFSEETLKVMLLDTIKMHYFKSAMSIVRYMNANHILCNVEHYIGLIRLSFYQNRNKRNFNFIFVAHDIWQEMITRHFSSKDSFVINVNTFRLLRQALNEEQFRVLLLKNVEHLNGVSSETVDNDIKESCELMFILLKFIQQTHDEKIAQWFEYHSGIAENTILKKNGSNFYKKVGLMLAVVLAKNSSNSNPDQYNSMLNKYLQPFCDDFIDNESVQPRKSKQFGLYATSILSNSEKSSFDDNPSNEWLLPQIENLIMNIDKQSVENLRPDTLTKILQLYAWVKSECSQNRTSHIVRDHLQFICLRVFTAQSQTHPSHVQTSELLNLIQACGLNTHLFAQLNIESNINYIIEQPSLNTENDEQKSETVSYFLPAHFLTNEYLKSVSNDGDFEWLTRSVNALQRHIRHVIIDDERELNEEFKKWIKQSVNGILRSCKDIEFAFMIIEKLVKNISIVRWLHLGYFHRLLDIGIEHPCSTINYSQIQQLLQLLLTNNPQIIIKNTETYEKMIEYCIAHRDIHGIMDSLQILFDFIDNDIDDNTDDCNKISVHLFEKIMCLMSEKCAEFPQIQISQVLKIFKKLQKYCPQPNMQTLYFTFKCYTATGDEIGLNTICDWLITHGIHIEYNVDIYNLFIECNAFHGKITESLQLYEQLLSMNIIPNIETFNGLLAHHMHENSESIVNVSFMLQKLEDMKEFSVNPTSKTYSIIIEYCAKHSCSEIAKQIMQLMMESEVHLSLDIISNYIRCFVTFDELMVELKQMIADGRQMLVNNTMLRILSENIHSIEIEQQKTSSLTFTLNCVSGMSEIMKLLFDNFEENSDFLELNVIGFYSVFDLFFELNLDGIVSHLCGNESNINIILYQLSQIMQHFWNTYYFMHNTFHIIPDYHILETYLYLENIRLEFYYHCIQNDIQNSCEIDDRIFQTYSVIIDSLEQFSKNGLFITSDVLFNMCQDMNMNESVVDEIMERFKLKQIKDRRQRAEQPLQLLQLT